MIEQERHLFVRDFVGPVSEKAGLSKRQSHRAISALCEVLGERLGDGSVVTLRNLGRLKPVPIKSHYRTDLSGNRVAQKLYYRIYFSPSEAVQRKLNKHLHEEGRHAKKQSRS